MKKKFFKSKLEMFLSIIIFILLLIGFIYFGNKDYSKKEELVIEQTVISFEDDNVYTFVNASDILNFIKGKNVIILFGVNNEFVKTYGNIVNNVAKNHNISSIYYYDIESDRTDNNASYRSIVEYLKSYTTMLDNGTQELFGPTLLIKKDNNIIYFDNENTLIQGKYTAEEYFDEYKMESIINKLNFVFDDYIGEIDE